LLDDKQFFPNMALPHRRSPLFYEIDDKKKIVFMIAAGFRAKSY